MKTGPANYLVERVKLQTQPRLFARFYASPSFASPLEYAFSRDFSTGAVASPAKTKLAYLMKVSGVAQSISPELGQSTIGQFTLTFQDLDGEILRHMGQRVLSLSGGITASDPPTGGTLPVSEDPSGFPTTGTVEVFTAGVAERIRYASYDAPLRRFVNITRGADGTVAVGHNVGDPVQNGEQIRPGTRVQLYAGYAGLAESDYMPYVKMLVMAREVAADGITITIQVADIQRTTRQTIFLGASPEAPVVLTGNPLTIALQVLLSTGLGTNGPYDVLLAANGLKVPQAFVDVLAIQALRSAEFPVDAYTYSIVSAQEGKRFLEKDILQSLNCYPVVTQDGKLSVKRYKPFVAPGTIAATLTQQDIIAWGWNAGDSNIINVVQFEYDFNLAAPAEFGLRQVYTKTASFSRYGARPRLLIQSMGIRKSVGAQAILDNRAFEVFRRFSEPPAQLTVQCFFRNHLLEPGDQVQITHPNILNINTGVRGLIGEVFEVVNMSPGFDAGMVTLQLLWIASIQPITPPTSEGEVALTPTVPNTAGLSWLLELSRAANVTFPAASVYIDDMTVFSFHLFNGVTVKPLQYDVSTDGGLTFPTMRATTFNPIGNDDVMGVRTVRLGSGLLRFLVLLNASQAIAYSDNVLELPTTSTWTQVTPPGSVGAPGGLEVNGLNAVVFLSGAAFLAIAYSTDGGATWTASTGTPAELGTTAFGLQVFASPSAGIWCFLNPNSGNIFRSTDSGATWGASVKTMTAGNASLPAVAAIFAVSATRLVAVYKGQVATSDDAGLTWTDRQNLTLASLSPLDVKQGGIGYIGSFGVQGGLTILGGATNYAMAFDSVTTRGAMWRSIDLGDTWALVNAVGGGLVTASTSTRITSFAARRGRGVIDIWNSGTTERKTWSSV